MLMATRLIGVGDIFKGNPTHKFTWFLNEVFMWGHMTNKISVPALQTRQGADLQWEAPILKATWPFDPVTKVRSRDNLKHLYFYYHKTYGH